MIALEAIAAVLIVALAMSVAYAAVVGFLALFGATQIKRCATCRRIIIVVARHPALCRCRHGEQSRLHLGVFVHTLERRALHSVHRLHRA